MAIGRLDINTEGLLLLTNDGGLARALELPSTGWLRRYRVRAHGSVAQADLDRLSDGITIDGIDYAGIEARLDREQGSNAWITMGLREGKNREIKRVLEHLGLSVNRLIRVSFGPFELGDLAEGEVAEVRTRILRDQLGVKLAREAGVDFDAPIVDHTPRPVEATREERPRRPAPSGRPRRIGLDRDRDEAPRRGPPTPPAPSTPERKRKHVSALREEIAADAAGPRKRIARGATQDRKGRTVAVERISKAVPEDKPDRRSRPPGRGHGADRPRRARVEGEEARPPRRAPRSEGDARSGPRTVGTRKPWEDRGPRAPRPPRAEGEAAKPYAARKAWEDRGPRTSRPPRAEGGETRPARRPPRAEGDSAKPYGARKPWEDRGPRAPRARGDEARPARRPPRAEGGPRDGSKSSGPRKPWEDRGARSPRAEGKEGRPPRRSSRDDAPRGAAGARAPDRFGGKPGGAAPKRAGKPGAGRPKGAGGPRRPPPKR